MKDFSAEESFCLLYLISIMPTLFAGPVNIQIIHPGVAITIGLILAAIFAIILEVYPEYSENAFHRHIQI